VLITPKAARELERAPAKEQAHLKAAIDGLTGGLRHGDIRKLRGKEDEWRLRCGDWRIRFRPDYDARIIVILRVLPRGIAYRD
jgi:mRNA-degrading endonuclease RelE of RelBE toxin-antitoxin system